MDVTDKLFDGRYTLDGILGSGGTGTVRRASDRVLDRPVALKMLRSGAVEDPLHRARLRAEAQLAGGLHHPGIAEIYDYGEAPPPGGDGTPTPYIAMQFVDGEPLSALLRERRRLPADEVMTIVAQVAEALQVAHEAGIVHRDLKPGNVLLTPDGRPVLVDFGIARADGLEPLTLTGTIVGTVDYISPEQITGSSATPRSDVYALGMVAYEALSGRRPFRRESEVATALAHLHDDLPPLPEDVPPAVAALVMEMAARDPEARPSSAGEVSARAAALALDPFDPRAATTVIARRRTDAGDGTAMEARRTPPWLRSRRTLVGAAVLAAAIASSMFVAARPAVHRVPDLRGMQFGAAVRALHDEGLDVVERTYVDDPGSARGTVLEQDPGPGVGAEEGDLITLEVASGNVRLRPARLVGEGYVKAAREIVELGLVPRRVQVARARGIGTVVAVGPAGRLPLGSLVTLSVAVPPEPEPAPAPVVSAVAPAPVTAPSGGSTRPQGGATAGPATPKAAPRAPRHHAAKAHGKGHGKKPGKGHGHHGKKK